MQVFAVSHPLTEGTKLEANKPQCPCKGSRWQVIQGTVKKVITNNSGVWYFLDTGYTVKAEWVQRTL